jgi:hypothetical protein
MAIMDQPTVRGTVVRGTAEPAAAAILSLERHAEPRMPMHRRFGVDLTNRYSNTSGVGISGAAKKECLHKQTTVAAASPQPHGRVQYGTPAVYSTVPLTLESLVICGDGGGTATAINWPVETDQRVRAILQRLSEGGAGDGHTAGVRTVVRPCLAAALMVVLVVFLLAPAPLAPAQQGAAATLGPCDHDFIAGYAPCPVCGTSPTGLLGLDGAILAQRAGLDGAITSEGVAMSSKPMGAVQRRACDYGFIAEHSSCDPLCQTDWRRHAEVMEGWVAQWQRVAAGGSEAAFVDLGMAEERRINEHETMAQMAQPLYTTF